MPVQIKTHEMPDVEKAESQVRNIQQEARTAEEKRKQLELLFREAQEAAERRERELLEAQTIEKEIGEVSGG